MLSVEPSERHVVVTERGSRAVVTHSDLQAQSPLGEHTPGFLQFATLWFEPGSNGIDEPLIWVGCADGSYEIGQR